MSVIAQPADLDTLLGLNGAIDTTRAQLILDLVEDDAGAVVSPLPATAKGVILTAAARAYPNPSGVASEGVGQVNTSFGPGAGGVYLSRRERRTLRRLAGIGGGAFTIDPTPATAAANYVDSTTAPTLDDSEQLVLDQPDPFVIP